MPGKKKKGKKKKKSSTKDDKPADDQPKVQNLAPVFIHPIRDAPIAKIQVQLANPNHGLFKMDLKMKTSSRLYSLQQKIKELHGGSIDNIRICLARYVDDQAITDPTLTLKDIGIATDGVFTVYYDFGVIPQPLLTTPLNTRYIDEDR